MASISSLSGSSNSSSIYGNRTYNIISGLASGLDTEELISGVVQSYQQKIQSLNQKNTKLQWQQEAYQSISDKLVEFQRNYASFAYSNNNLASSSFFNNAVNTTTGGTYADLVTASGKTSSEIVLNAVSKLASAARATTSANGLKNGIKVSNDNKTVTATAGNQLNLDKVKLSTLSGSLTLTYGSSDITLNFDKGTLYEQNGTFNNEKFKTDIETQLKEQNISFSGGSTSVAFDVIGVEVRADGTVSFTNKISGGNTLVISDASGDLEDMIQGGVTGESSTMKLNLTGDADNGYTGATQTISSKEYLKDKTITVTLNGTSKTITLPEVIDASDTQSFVSSLNAALGESFGKDSLGNNNVSVAISNQGEDAGKLAFTTANGSTLSVSTSDSGVGAVLGIDNRLTNYLDTTKTLEDLNVDWDNLKTNDEGKYDLVINGVTINSYSKDTELNTILNDINSNTEAGVNVSYSKTTGQFVFTAKDTGSGGHIKISGNDPSDSSKSTLGAEIFGAIDPNNTSSTDYTYNPGQDAEFIATINGQAMKLTRSSNSFDLDGMQITVSGTFNEDATISKDTSKVEMQVDGKTVTADAVTFTSKADADKIVGAVKKMVEDFNTLIKEVKSAYSDMPLQKSDGSKYEPLTDEDMEGMSDSAIESYEEKAKTGILFMDSDLSSLYNDLRNAIASSGADGVTLRSIGISTSYSDGLTTLSFDETTFREALENNPDKVQEAFTKSKENGAATNGLMASLTTIIDKYAATTGATKGILIEKAGSKYSPTAALDNEMLNKMQDVEDEITKWQEKMSDKVDYYTNKFTQLELLINQMNSQSSALSGLLGG